MERYDVVVVGGGIAGVSVAYGLAADRSVALVEAEASLAVHTTGRSAATWIGGYGPPVIQDLTARSRAFLEEPPLDVDGPLITPLPCLHVGTAATPEAEQKAIEVARLTDAQPLTPLEAAALNPVLRSGVVTHAVLDPTACALDVHGLHQGYVRGLRARGGVIYRSARLTSAARQRAEWVLTTAAVELTAPVVVNAAGAWGDQVGALFGSKGQKLEARRRSMVTAPTAVAVKDMPFTCDLGGGWYFKAEGDSVLCSPEDATPHEPGDPKPDELQIARALEDINAVTSLGLRSVRSAWAGLRTFGPTGEPVVAWDELVDGLFWFVGQGGYGIQAAPALANRAAEIVRDT